MPLRKRIITTNFYASGNPLQSGKFDDGSNLQPPFLIKKEGVCVGLDPVNLYEAWESWDFLVFHDAALVESAYKEYFEACSIEEKPEVIWLRHAGENIENGQIEILKRLLGDIDDFAVSQEFSHTDTGYRDYLNYFKDLWKGELSYGECIACFDRVLMKNKFRQLCSEFLWFWAATIEIPQDSDNDREVRIEFSKRKRQLIARIEENSNSQRLVELLNEHCQWNSAESYREIKHALIALV